MVYKKVNSIERNKRENNKNHHWDGSLDVVWRWHASWSDDSSISSKVGIARVCGPECIGGVERCTNAIAICGSCSGSTEGESSGWAACVKKGNAKSGETFGALCVWSAGSLGSVGLNCVCCRDRVWAIEGSAADIWGSESDTAELGGDTHSNSCWDHGSSVLGNWWAAISAECAGLSCLGLRACSANGWWNTGLKESVASWNCRECEDGEGKGLEHLRFEIYYYKRLL